MKYKFIDLFAGCGGLEDGFLQSEKYKAVASVEWLKPQVNTLIHRLEKKWNYQNAKDMVLPVSYTHLTLPTIYSV